MKNFLYFLFIAVFFNVSLATAETPEEKGLAIAQEDEQAR